MKITLKKVKTFVGNEGYGLNADVYVDGVKTFFFVDDASGSIFAEHSPIYNKEKYDELQKYADSLPEYPLHTEEDIQKYKYEQAMMKVTIDHLINEVFDQMQKEKESKKLEKRMLTHILWGNERTYYEIPYKGFRLFHGVLWERRFVCK